MDDAEVNDLSADIDLDALLAYWRALEQRTLDVMTSLSPDDLDVVVPDDQVKRVCRDDGALSDRAAWVEAFWAGKSRAWLLSQLALVHPQGHFYEARVVKGLWGVRSR